jgi:peptidoglycan/LPS O-acetylase OafA/YrhL
LYISNIVQGIQGDFSGSIAPHFWSLAVEEQFYILWPLLIILVRNKTYQFVLSLLIFLSGTLFMIFSENQFLMARTLGCLAYLGSGALLAYLWHYNKEKILKLRNLLNLILILFLILVFFNSFGYLIMGYKIHLLITILLIPIITIRFAIGFKNELVKLVVENPIIIYLGKISYGIYIFHLLALFPAVAIKYYFNLTFLDNLWAMFFFKIVLTILISAISWEFFEKRINRYKSKFDYK